MRHSSAEAGLPIEPTKAAAAAVATPTACNRPTSTLAPRRRHGLARLEFALTVLAIALLVAGALQALLALRGPAHEARLRTLAGELLAAAALFHALCEVQRRAASGNCERLEVDGRRIDGRHGYPQASAEGIVRLAALDAPSRVGPPLRIEPLPGHAPAALRIGLAPAHGADCRFTYTEAPHRGAAPLVDTSRLSCH